ncbi:MAG: glycoside hydrolase [Rhodanobacteraceae bacterium]|nr:MAG: glycoside hydrolase [Rhodanobacteraceae bacterium]
MRTVRIQAACFCVTLVLLCGLAHARGTVPTFDRTIGGNTYTFVGHDPAVQGTTVIPVLLVPIRLEFAGKSDAMDATPDVPHILRSPIFSKYDFAKGKPAQYTDALLRATFPQGARGHTLLGTPKVKAITIEIPPGHGYLLHSKREGRSFAVVDSQYVEQQLFRQIPKQRDRLVIAVTHDTTFYAMSDATVCCSWGTHGVDRATGNSFVLGSYIHDAPGIVRDRDIQPLTEQLAEFFNDPLHDPATYFHKDAAPGNWFATWRRPFGDHYCGGSGVGTNYFLLEPTDSNLKNNFPASTPYVAKAEGFDYHLQNVALLAWYLREGNAQAYSFPDKAALKRPAESCERLAERQTVPDAKPVASSGSGNGHWLIGYWTGSGYGGVKPLRLRDVSPQWDVVIVAFASPAEGAPEGTLRFTPPTGMTPDEVKSDIAYLKRRGKKVMISLGGGGKYFKLDQAQDIPNFVDSVSKIVSEYGFQGIDLDFESPSLELAPGDTDFRHPTTPSIVNLIRGLKQLRARFGPGFMISLVPEGTQVPGGYPSYGGQFGSYLPIVQALRNDLAFVDVQDYNTPPLQGLDGEIYQSHTLDYHAAMTELLLHGFDVGGNPKMFFPPLPADKVAVGFLTGYDTPELVHRAMQYLITGKASGDVAYKLRKPGGYPAMIGAMFWTIDADHNEGYRYSNLIGPQLHGFARPQR